MAEGAASSKGPEVPIEVDQETGRWRTDGLPMLYVPQHFFINNHLAIEAELGVHRYAEILYEAGYTSAWQWCEKEAKTHNIRGESVFFHYMNRLSQRGWGLFDVRAIDLETGTATVAVRHSVFADALPHANRKVDYMFSGWFSGSMDQILADRGSAIRTVSLQAQSAAENGCAEGIFDIEPIA